MNEINFIPVILFYLILLFFGIFAFSIICTGIFQIKLLVYLKNSKKENFKRFTFNFFQDMLSFYINIFNRIKKIFGDIIKKLIPSKILSNPINEKEMTKIQSKYFLSEIEEKDPNIKKYIGRIKLFRRIAFSSFFIMIIIFFLIFILLFIQSIFSSGI